MTYCSASKEYTRIDDGMLRYLMLDDCRAWSYHSSHIVEFVFAETSAIHHVRLYCSTVEYDIV